MEKMENLHYLPHDGGVEALSELNQSGIKKTLQIDNIVPDESLNSDSHHEIVFHEIENKIEGALVFPRMARSVDLYCGRDNWD